MSVSMPARGDPGLTGAGADLRPEDVILLNRESRNVVGKLARYRSELLSRVNRDGVLWACSEEPAPGASGSGDLREAGAVEPGSTFGFSPFHYYPFLFSTAFADLPGEFLGALASANRILLEALLVSDNRIDFDQSLDPLDLYLSDGYYHRALEILVPFLPPEDPFWKQCEALYLAYGRAVLQELLLHRYRVEPYPLEEFKAISAGKAGLIKTTVLALCALSGRDEHRERLLLSQDAFLAGFQAFDDLKDWREDWARQNYTYLLTSLLEEAGLVGAVEAGERPDPEEIGRHLYHSGRAEKHLSLSEDLFQASLQAVGDLPVPLWREVVKGFLRNAGSMREDLKEIRRRDLHRDSRTGCGDPVAGQHEDAVPGTSVSSLERGVRFLPDRQQPDGSFCLASSPHSYMRPENPLGPSRAVTELMRRAVAPLENAQPGLESLLRRASTWLKNSARTLDPALPAGLEVAFRERTPEELERFETEMRALRAQTGHEGFAVRERALWAEVLCQASAKGVALPCLEAHASEIVQTGQDPAAFCRVPEGDGRCGMLQPALVKYLLCRSSPRTAEGSAKAGRQALHARLLSGSGKSRIRGSYMDTALALSGLRAGAVETPRFRREVRRLLHGQEPDGSWPPNAFYSKDGIFYGSRELTTAWCLEALFHCSQRLCSSASPVGPAPEASGKSSLCSAMLHTGVAAEIHAPVLAGLARLECVLPARQPVEVWAGRWDSMPGHFLVAKDGWTAVGINLAGADLPLRSVGQRLLAAELAMGWAEAVRLQTCGPLRTRLEHLYVDGIGMLLCRRLWPGQTPWEQSGMTRLDWHWCHENEWCLREHLRQGLCESLEVPAVVPWPDASPVLPAYVPRNAHLYLAIRLFELEMKTGLCEGRLRELLSQDLHGIGRQVQGLWGAGVQSGPACL